MVRVDFDSLSGLVTRIFAAHGMSQGNAAIIARVLVEAERDGTTSHGLFRVSGYLATLTSGHVDGMAHPIVDDVAPSVVKVDAGNGFAQPALAAGRALVTQKAHSTGVAVMAINNCHHFAPLWTDVEPFAEDGLVAMALDRELINVGR